jgi:hypothetical protein
MQTCEEVEVKLDSSPDLSPPNDVHLPFRR